MIAEKIGFLGLGSMGAPMARNLLKSGLAVTVYNRTRTHAEALNLDGAEIAETPAGAIVEGGIAITMLAHDAALEAVTLGPDGILEKLGKGGLHISMSTVSPETSKKLAALHAANGSLFLSAPVFGRPEAAAAKKLWICQSGSGEAKQRAQAILDILGQGIHDFDLLHARLLTSLAKKRGNLDWTAIELVTAEDAALRSMTAAN